MNKSKKKIYSFVIFQLKVVYPMTTSLLNKVMYKNKRFMKTIFHECILILDEFLTVCRIFKLILENIKITVKQSSC